MILDRILEHKKAELRRKQSRGYVAELKGRIANRAAPSGFIKALEAGVTEDSPALIAEVKKASPSQGLMRPEFAHRFDPVEIAKAYERSGAAALSVLTDQEYFQGCLDDLAAVNDHVALPTLNKEFMLEDIQFYEARAYGADCVLLIVSAVDRIQLQDLYSVARGLELDVLLHQVASLIKTEYAYDYVSIYLLDEKTSGLRIQAGTGEAGRVLCLAGASLPVDEKSLIGWVGVNGRSLRIADVNQDSRYVKLQSDFSVRSELDLPLLMGNQLLGVLNIQSRKVDAFSVNDLNFLQLLATQVAIAIFNASLYEREKSARYLAETLQDTGRALTSTLKWDEVIDSILEGLEKIVTYDRASVLVRRDNDLEIMAARGFPDGFDPTHFRISLDNELIYRQIKESKRPLAIPDVQQRSDWRSSDALQSPRSWLGVPLIRQNIVTGMLSLARETVQPYTDEEIKLATAFAAQAVIALENARLYEQKSRFNKQLEYEVRQRTEAIQTAYEKLEHLNRSKSDFIRIISHELRTPVTILSGYSQMLVKDQAVVENDMLSHLAAGMKRGASRLQEIINSMLDVAKIDNHELNIYPSPISVAAIARIVTEDFSESLQVRNLTLKIEEMPTLPIIYADSEALQKVFYHLITNAIKYTPDGGHITISGGLVSGDLIEMSGKEAIEMVVADTGIGIDRAMHDLVFDKFYQTGEVSLHSSSRTMFKGGGPGLGLAVCRGIVEAHKGKLWVESTCHDEESCPGSAFHMVLPVLKKGDLGVGDGEP